MGLETPQRWDSSVFLSVPGRSKYSFCLQVLSKLCLTVSRRTDNLTIGNFKFEFKMTSLANKRFKTEIPLSGMFPRIWDLRDNAPRAGAQACFLVRLEMYKVFIYLTVLIGYFPAKIHIQLMKQSLALTFA